jgi:2,3-bisphosphoglycerate-dependent phosphoglycerate mutase
LGFGELAAGVVTVDLVRHGATEWSSTGRYTGRTDLPLSRSGRQEAAALMERLRKDDYHTVWSSPLLRAVETASLAGFVPQIDERLAEFNFGDIEGSRWEDLAADVQQSLVDFDSFVAPGGESVVEFTARVLSWWDELDPGRHLAFCHGGVIRVIQRHLGADLLAQTGAVVSAQRR